MIDTATATMPAPESPVETLPFTPGVWPDRATICHANARGTGSAIRFELHPARGKTAGYLFVEVARQKTVASMQGEVPAFATFDWANKVCCKMGLGDLAQMLMVFRYFFQCRCEQLELREIAEIVPYWRQKELWLKVNTPESSRILFNKYSAYLHFKEDYKRDVIIVRNNESSKEFSSFCHSHPVFVVKPLDLNCGRGIQIIDIRQEFNAFERLLEMNPKGFIVEELIKQDESLSKLHPTSINTLRINTVNFGTTVDIKWPCLRIGRGGSIVDNAGAGGVFGAIDEQTGVIIKVSDEFHHTFEEHPDTGIPLVGLKVPKWKEACILAKRLAEALPGCRFIGWDFALTDKGWAMVEGNHSPLLIWQIAAGLGIRNDFLRMKRRLLRK